MKKLVFLVCTACLLAIMTATAPSFAATSCSCNISCPNGTSCQASGVCDCDCSCSWWTGDANCSASAIVAAVNSGANTLLVDRMDAVQVALESTVGEPESLSELFHAAGQALVMEDAAAYESTIKEIDNVVVKRLTDEEDLALAAALRSLTR